MIILSLFSYSVSAKEGALTSCLNEHREHKLKEKCIPAKKKKKKSPKGPAKIEFWGKSRDMCLTDEQYIELSNNVLQDRNLIQSLVDEEVNYLIEWQRKYGIADDGVTIDPNVKVNAEKIDNRYNCPQGTSGYSFFIARPEKTAKCPNPGEKPYCILVKSGANAKASQCGSNAAGRYLYKCFKTTL